MNNLEFLKEVLSVPTSSYKEELMIKYLENWLNENNIPYYVDEFGNVYATKKTDLKEDEFFPCVVSHTDTVHNISNINILEKPLPDSLNNIKLALTSVDDNGNPNGIGGDDKCGVYICLRLLKELPNVKAAFFVSEEVGCKGSLNADANFFKDVGYAIQFDAPENWMITYTCMGVELFDMKSEFFNKCDNILTEKFNHKKNYLRHPYTDVYALRKKFDFACINISCGYYNYHRLTEYVIVDDVENAFDIGIKMINELGYNNYVFKKPEKVKFVL